jgi:tRNA (cmo5U34)-methyltransferase
VTQVPWDPETYLQDLLQEVPSYPELQEQAARAAAAVQAETILELGIGTGETAKRILAAHRTAKLTAVDSSEAMLGRARSVVPGADLRLARLQDPLPDGPFDLVVSALAVHHLDGPGKQDLFRRVAAVLKPGGTFVLADLVVPEDDADVITEIDWDYDLPDRLDDQLAWLRDAGLDAETVWSHKDLAVMRATRPPRPG